MLTTVAYLRDTLILILLLIIPLPLLAVATIHPTLSHTAMITPFPARTYIFIRLLHPLRLAQ